MKALDARAELLRLWQLRLDQALAALAAAGQRSTDTQAVALRHLQLLQGFLQVAEPAARIAEALPATSGQQLLCELLRCQRSLKQQAGSAEPQLLLRQHVQQGLTALAAMPSPQQWSLPACVAGALAGRLHQLGLLAHFAGELALAQQLQVLVARYVLWHASAAAPPVDAWQAWRRALCQLAADMTVQLDLSSWLSVASWAQDPQATAELAAQDQALQPLLAPQILASEAGMFACYRRSWLLQALGADAAAQAGCVLYQLLAQHWQLRRPLALPVQALLQAWLQTPAADAALRAWLACLAPALACWPLPEPAPDTTASAVPADNAAMRSLGLERLPEYLAATLAQLLQARPEWFASRAAWQQQAARLQHELRVLEQGAAALRLLPLERHVGVLMDLHALLALELPQQPWPGELLCHAHQNLVALLDRAALWLEPLPQPALQAALDAALLDGIDTTTAWLRSGNADAPRQLTSSLVLFGQQAARLLGHGVRVACEPAQQLPADGVALLLPLLQDLLRTLVLHHHATLDQLRTQRRPQACDINLRLRLHSTDACEVDLLERGQSGLPAARLLRRVQRSLGPAATQLHCAQVPQGRRWRCRLLHVAKPV